MEYYLTYVKEKEKCGEILTLKFIFQCLKFILNISEATRGLILMCVGFLLCHDTPEQVIFNVS